jgi:hypothetical protein
LTPSPILKVLSTLTTSGVRSLLMGGQACVLYGGAEFSRDTDIVVLADDDNLGRLVAAVAELEADVIAVPPFLRRHLEAGHAVYFRCRAGGVEGMRLDVMARDPRTAGLHHPLGAAYHDRHGRGPDRSAVAS